ncbi:MAG: hypothetical protein KC431_26015, partial [Myxococcales bacterium]|nr:hypothetical protein [Myxococcales bacterium]
VDALRDRELRSFPYLGNVPVRRWTGAADDPAACVDLLLKESLRCELAELALEHNAQPGDHLIYAAPELATLIGLEPGTRVLYPDPPIGDEELQLLAPLGLKLETPMLRAAAEHSLAGKTITLSASASSDAAVHGLTPRHLDEAMLDLCRQLLLRGASLAYGGHLDREGYTARLLDLTLAHRSLSELPPVERVRCYLGWTLGRPKQRLAAHQRAAKWIFMPRPDGIEDLEPERFTASLDEFLPCDSPARRYAWGKAMTQMRRRQAAETDARVLIGGKIGGEGSWYLGSIPGLVEEALCTLEAKKPLFVVGAFGGAGALIGDLLQGKARPEMTWEYQSRAPHAVEMRKLYEDRDGGFVDYGEIVRRFADTGLGGLDNGLSAEQNLELLRTRDLERVVALIIEG